MTEVVEDNIIKGEENRKQKVMTVFAGNTLREIVNTANLRMIEREDIVSLLKENGQFWLVYYK